MKHILPKLLALSRQASLKIKISILISVLVVTLTVGITAFLVYHLEGQLKLNIHDQQYSLVTVMAGNIDNKINTAQQSLLAVSRQISRDVLPPEAAQRFLDLHDEQLVIFDQGIFLFTPKGDLIAESPFLPDRRGKNFAYREYFQKTVASGRPVISAPYLSSKEKNSPSIMFTAPIHDRTGNLVAVLGGSMKLLGENFLAQIPRTKVGDTGYVYIYNDDRTIILHPDPKRILQQDVPRGVNPLFDQAIDGFEGTGVTVTSRGLTVLASFKRLKSTNWIMAANYPIEEAYSAVSQAEKMVIACIIPLGLLTLGGSLFSLQRIFRPLAHLTSQVRHLTLSQAPKVGQPESWKNEIAILTEAFQDFVAQQDNDRATLLEEKNRAEAERGKSEAVIAAIGDGLNIMDLEFRILYQNTVTRDLIGDRRGEFCYRAIHQRNEPCPECALAKAIQDGQVHILEHSVKIGEKTIHVELTASPVRDADGKIIAGVEIVRDITEHKAAEERLCRSEQRLAEAQRIAHIGSYEWDIPKNEVHWSDELHLIFGLPPGEKEFSFGTVLNFVHPEHRTVFTETVQKALQTTKAVDHVYSIVRPDGTVRMIHSQGRVFDDETGRPVRLVGVCLDITARRQAEENLRILSEAVRQSPASIIITDLKAQIQYINPSFIELTGYTLEEVLDRNPSLLASGHTPKEVYRELWETLEAGKKWCGEFQNKKKNGELYWEQAMIAPIIDAAGMTTHFIAIKEDMTERKTLERQLRHGQKMEAIGQLAAGVAHDFNNLLTAIIGYASIQQFKAEEGSTLKSDLAGILMAANRGTKLTRDLLAFSRKSSPEQATTEFQVVDLNELVTRGGVLLQRMLGETIELIVQLTPGELPMRANAQNLDQALLNLGANARDAMPQGGRLCLHTESALLDQQFVARHGYGSPGRYAVLTISDSGGGMDQETVKRIFEPFFTTKEVGKGSGLGLSITYGIIKQHQGYITCDSEPGQGTTFRLFLPLEEGVDRAPKQALPGQSVVWGRETILLAEDDATTRAMVRTLLEESGYGVIEAIDGEEALQQFRANRNTIGCLILDSYLPKRSGVELFREIIALDPDARVILCSGYPAETAMQQGLVPAGANFLAKPFFPKQLLSKLREVLDR